MEDEQVQVDLLKRSGYSEKAIAYFIKRVNVGEIENPSASLAYTRPCGDTMQIQLKANSGRITNAKFQAIGCPGSYAAGSALTETIKRDTLEEAGKITEDEILNHLGDIPPAKIHCVCLAKRTLDKTIEQYKSARDKR